MIARWLLCTVYCDEQIMNEWMNEWMLIQYIVYLIVFYHDKF
jgi:hypothetical protein